MQNYNGNNYLCRNSKDAQELSAKSVNPDFLIPIIMDVTNQSDIDRAVGTVSAW